MAARKRGKGRGPVTPLRLGLTLLMFGLGAAILLDRSSAPAEVELPEGLRGTWTTDDPRYGERALELSTEGITFSTPTESVTYPIIRVEQGPEEDSRLYTIRFEVDQQVQQLSVLFDDDPRLLRLQNQPHVEWRQPDTRS